jgi:hypothetical protein
MKESLVLFTRIISHLEWLTTKDAYGTRRSKGIETREDLAEELNEQGIVPKRGYWTTHSLEQFLIRMLKQYGANYLWRLCDVRFLNAQNWEYISGTCHSEIVGNSKGRTTTRNNGRLSFREAEANTFRTTSNDLWKSHERNELDRDFHNNIQQFKTFLRRKRRLGA